MNDVRRILLAGGLVAALLSLGACSDDAPTPARPDHHPTAGADAVQASYGVLLPAVDAALVAAGVRTGEVGGRVSFSSSGEKGQCLFRAGSWTSPEHFGEDVSWDTVREAVAAALEPAGFELTEMLLVPGGFTGFDAADETGAQVTVRAKQTSTITLSAPVLGACPVAP